MQEFIITTPKMLEAMIKASMDEVLKEHHIKNESAKARKKQYTIKEAATELNVSALSVRNYITKGYLKATKIGRRILISNESLEKAMKEVKSLKYKR
jgi:excisionase family DNA binding protein